MSDVRVENQGNIFLVALKTPEARAWVDENVEESAQFWGDELVVEHHYIEDLVSGMILDGLTVE